MLTRISLLGAIIATLIIGGSHTARTVGQHAEGERQESHARHQVHPVGMALENAEALGLSEKQVAVLRDMLAELKEAGSAAHAELERLERRIHELKEAGQLTEATLEALKGEQRDVQGSLGQLRERLAHALTGLLTEEQLQRLHAIMQEREARRHDDRESPTGLRGHPIAWALELHERLGMNEEQIKVLRAVWAALKESMANIGRKMEEVERRVAELKETGRWNEEAAADIERHMAALHRAADKTREAGGHLHELLTEDQMRRLEEIMDAQHAGRAAREFLLEFLMAARERLEITPQQFTQLQYLQADYIRAFAPVRERAELLEIRVHEEFEGREPPPDIREEMQGLERAHAELREAISQRALEVLTPDQRERLERILHPGGRRERREG
ncbi:MAG: hypothetical protein IH851_07840 [Armatimonadetes bacterium]|nr:hypothetical protein [Armatimonadota bacterium]